MIANIQPDYKLAEQEANSLLKKECFAAPPVLADEIAKNVGLKVYSIGFSSLDFPFGDISGFIDANTNTMYINSDEPPKRQNFTIAHELGHFILGHIKEEDYKLLFRKSQLERDKLKIEKEANCFAANLLVPTTFIKKIISDYPFITNYQLSNLFGVSETVIRHRRSYIGV